MIKIKRYSPPDLSAWNEFVDAAKNSTFLFKREYVDYHHFRFKDHSLMIYNDEKLSALFIANETNDTIESHGGLTYGGLILKIDVQLEKVLQYFYHLVEYYSRDFKRIIYKCFPSYLVSYPSNEDLYALFLLKAELFRRDTSMVIDLNNPLPKHDRTARSFKSFEAGQYAIKTVTAPEKFWNELLIPNLWDRFETQPAHNISEIRLLMSRFPDNIKLYEVHDVDIVAGAVVYATPRAAHLQYLSSNIKGREIEASGVLMHHLIEKIYPDKHYFSFGTTNANGGRQLNMGLAKWKEGFGARTFTHDFYEIQSESFVLLKEYR